MLPLDTTDCPTQRVLSAWQIRPRWAMCSSLATQSDQTQNSNRYNAIFPKVASAGLVIYSGIRPISLPTPFTHSTGGRRRDGQCSRPRGPLARGRRATSSLKTQKSNEEHCWRLLVARGPTVLLVPSPGHRGNGVIPFSRIPISCVPFSRVLWVAVRIAAVRIAAISLAAVRLSAFR